MEDLFFHAMRLQVEKKNGGLIFSRPHKILFFFSTKHIPLKPLPKSSLKRKKFSSIIHV